MRKLAGKFLAMVVLLLIVKTSDAQITTYTFSAFSGTYTAIAGTSPTLTPDGTNPTADEGYANNIPIGFTFTYNGSTYNNVCVTTNGMMGFGTLDAWWPGNNLSANGVNGSIITRPILSPLWNDLELASVTDLQYITTGSSGSRVFTMQWSNVYWDYTAATPAISFQVILFEGTNIIQFIYSTLPGAIVETVGGASIGITATATGTGNYLSLNGSSASPTISSTTSTNNISTKPANNQVYQFSPPPPCTGTPNGGTAAAVPTTVACGNTSIALSVTGSTTGVTGLSYQWQSSPDNLLWTNIAGATATSYSSPGIGATTYFRRGTICTVDTGFTPGVMVAYTGPSAPSGTGGIRCGIGTVNLTASGSPTLTWYAASSGGVSLGTGSPFTTPSISATTTYYVESSTGSSVTVGPVSPTAQGGTIGTQTIAWDVNFTTLTSTTLQSVDIFPVASGQSGVIRVLSGTGTGGTILATINYTTTVSGGLTAQTIPINYTISTPGNYSLYTSTLPSSGIRRNTSGASYPYTSAVANITGNGFDNTYFMGMYRWVFGSSCASGRTPVVATVTTPPAISVNASANPVCLGNSTTITASSANTGYSYNWVPGGANPLTVSPSVSTKYVVTATDASGGPNNGCVNKDSVTITVNTVVPTSPTVTPSSGTICPNGDAVQLTANGATINSPVTFGTQTTQNTGVVASTDYPAPYTLYYGGQRMQMLIRASELTAAGFTAGSQFTGLQFPVVTRGSNWGVTTTALQSFQVSIGHTALTTLSAFQTGLTQVIAPASFTPVVGYTNTHTFSSGFTWNGTSNLIIETTFSNNVFGTLNDLVVQYNSPTAFQSTIVYRVDSQAPATVAASTTVTYSYSARPDFKLIGPQPYNNYFWSPTTGLYTDASATLPYTGSPAITTVYASPTTTTTYNATASNGCTSPNSNNAVITVTTAGNPSGLASVAGGSQVCISSSITANTTKRFFDGSGAGNCNLIATVQSTGATPVSGTINVCVKKESAVQIYNSDPYLTRHFDIEPSVSASTAKITVYVLQSEFDDYNINNLGFPDLPSGPLDAAGIANVRLTQFHGVATQPAPGFYPGGAELIDPVNTDIVWNASRGWWEISFNVTSFSGFYIHSSIYGFPLPSLVIRLSGRRVGTDNVLSWTTTSEQSISGYTVERSYDGTNFTPAGFVPSKAPGGTSNDPLHYTFTDMNVTSDRHYYRLKQTAIDGRVKLSSIILIKGGTSNLLTIDRIFPNPASSVVNIMTASPTKTTVTMELTDINGKVLVSKTAPLEQGANTITADIQQLAAGIYFIRLGSREGLNLVTGRFTKQ